MIKSLWNSLFSEEEAPAAVASVPRDKLLLLLEHFPIGRKLRYYPEYKRDIVLQTIIVAYRVNDHFIYSRDAVETDDDGNPIAFRVGEERTRLPFNKVERLQIIVPDTSNLEYSLDYVTRAAIGRAGQFRQGNAITLVADSGERGIPTLETEVDLRVNLTDGPYKGEHMIRLEPDFDSLGLQDQRQKERVSGGVPVVVYGMDDDKPPARCVLGDFSDNAIRLCKSPDAAMPVLEAEDEVVIVIDLGDANAVHRIKGIVYRCNAESCVVNLDRIFREGKFDRFHPMDLLEIKTGLLNYRR